MEKVEAKRTTVSDHPCLLFQRPPMRSGQETTTTTTTEEEDATGGKTFSCVARNLLSYIYFEKQIVGRWPKLNIFLALQIDY